MLNPKDMKKTTFLKLTSIVIALIMCALPMRSEVLSKQRVILSLANGTTLKADVLTERIIHVAAFAPGATMEIPESQSAVLKPIATAVKIDYAPHEVTLATSKIRLQINRDSGAITFMTPDNHILLKESAPIDNRGSVKKISFTAPGHQLFYGAGERGHSLALNGDTLRMFNRQNYGYTGSDPRISQMGITVPWFASDAGYGVLIDDYNDATLILNDTIEYESATPQPLSYYFIGAEKSLAGVIDAYTELTGRQPLPPLWALGYITSKYGYKTQQEAVTTVDSLRNMGYPLDGIVFDLYWYGKETDMGRLEWNKEQFPDHRKMLRYFADKGIHTILISQPYINKIGAIDNYRMLGDKGMLAKDSAGNVHDVHTWVGDAGMFDVSNPATRQWLWNRYKLLTDDGIDGWWGDLGEPEVHPLTIHHANGQTASQYHNVYGNEWSRILYEGFRKDYPDRRVMLLMRGGTAGLQRYGVFPWSTDVSRSWGGLEPQVAIMLNSGLSGLGYMSSDLGGFAVDEANPTDPELYLRWVQLGAFTPTFRTHAQLKPEPFHYPEFQNELKEIVAMRYRWLPYNYTLAFENAKKGAPLARPLNFYGDTPADTAACIRDEYLWGRDVLVAPVMQQGQRERKVFFPVGEWYDISNPALRYKGLTTAMVSAPLDKIPLFARAGAFIAQYMETITNTSQYDPSRLTVDYYIDSKKTTSQIYDDDKVSASSIERGAYRLINLSGEKSGNTIRIGWFTEGKGYAWMPSQAEITMRVIGMGQTPKGILIGNNTLNPAQWSFDNRKNILTFSFKWDYSPLKIVINQ